MGVVPPEGGVSLGSVTIDPPMPLPTGASTDALQTAGNTTLTAINSALAGVIAVSGPLTNAQLRASPVPTDIISPLPAGTNNIGDVDVLTLPGGLTGKAEDSVAANLDVGAPILGVRNDAGVAKTSTDGDYSMVATDAAGRIGIATLGASIDVSYVASASGGFDIYKNLDVGATGQLIKGSAGKIGSIIVTNDNNADRFLKFYNKATAPIVGTDIPVFTLRIDGHTGGGQTGVEVDIANGINFSLGIGVGATTGIADSNTGATSLNDVVLAVFYK